MNTQRNPVYSNAGLDHKTKRFVVYTAVVVSSVIALTIIFVVALMPVFKQGYTIPTTLQNWGGLIIGFYFGSFVTLLKDWSRETVEIHQVDANRD